MNSSRNKQNTSTSSNGRHKQVRWFSLLLGAGVLVASGMVVADVILTYSLQSNVGAAGSSPFDWNQGSNYATASQLTLVSAGCTGAALSASNCYALAADVNGISSVPTTIVNVYEFDMVLSSTASWSATEGVVGGTLNLGAGACADLFLSNTPLTPSSFTYTSACSVSAVAPNSGGTLATGLGCGLATGAPGTVAKVDLTTAVAGSISVPCTTAASQGASSLLFVGYYIYIPAGNVISGNGATIDVSMTG